MLQIITATELTHNTKKVINKVVTKQEPVIVSNYHEPIAVIMDYSSWQAMSGKKAPKLEELEKFMDKTSKPTNMTKIIRALRDAE